MDKKPVRAKAFVKFLRSRERENDTGAMADLRKGFSPATAPYAWRHISRFCDVLTNSRSRTICETVGAAFATHPMFQESDSRTKTPNMGTVMREIAIKRADDKDKARTIFEPRFRRILTCDSAKEVCSLLRGVISAAKQKEIPIPYESLLTDLLRWDRYGQDVKVSWASEFWKRQDDGDDEDDNEADAQHARTR